MKLSSTFFNTYHWVKPCSSTTSMPSLQSEFSVEVGYEEGDDTYQLSPLFNDIEEDLYYRLQRHQRDFLPRMNPYFWVVIHHIRVVSNSASMLSQYPLRSVQDKSNGHHRKKRYKKKKNVSSAFTKISNLAEE